MVKISPSLLSADFANLEKELKALEVAGADMIHIDVMDGHFVSNITMGPPIIKALRKHTKLPFDVHLMINNPERWIKDYIDAGANIITIHPEATLHLDMCIAEIRRNLGVKAGISLLPTTPINIVHYIIKKIDMILVMSVNPGFGGQTFIYNQLKKITELSNIINTGTLLSVDGGINEETSSLCIKAGANCLVSGNYIFTGNYEERINKLRC